MFAFHNYIDSHNNLVILFIWKNYMITDFSLQLKTLQEDGIFEGYASVFNIIDDMQDVILPGAFQDSLKSHKVKLLWQHNHESPIGKISNIYENGNGLYIKAQLILETQQGKEAYHLLKSDIINGLSIGYIPLSHNFNTNTGIRSITKIDLWEISLVTFPANQFSTVTSCKNTSLHTEINNSLNSLKKLML